MAADSRLTLNQKRPSTGDNSVVNLSVAQTDSTNKLFQPRGTRVGISTVGDADVAGTPIGGYMQDFENSLSEAQDLSVEQLASGLLGYFHGLPGPPSVIFHVAGYCHVQAQLLQQVWQVSVAEGSITQMNVKYPQGAVWNGESDTMKCLLSPAWQKDDRGQYTQMLQYEIPWGYFTLQDAVDFSIYAIRTTIDTMRFQVRPKTVGGPIDVLVIEPSRAYWVQHKALHA